MTRPAIMGAGRGGRGGQGPPWILKFSAKKVCFLNFEEDKSNFTTFGPFWKNFGKIHPLPGKSFRRPWLPYHL